MLQAVIWVFASSNFLNGRKQPAARKGLCRVTPEGSWRHLKIHPV